MKINKKLLPYYLSRAVLASLAGWFLSDNSGSIVIGVAIGLLTFAGFVYYLHSGRFIVDESHPYFPLRRDEWAVSIRNKALVAAVAISGLVYFLVYLLNQLFSLPWVLPSLAIPLGVVVYFVYSIVMDKKS